jgi:holo-[acyl-carrier protein] synthase
MIIGLGTDIVEIKRIKESITKHSEIFIDKIFTDNEKLEASKRSNNITYYAGRWAAKEALAKALGTGFGKMCSWKDISIENDIHGKPIITLSGSAADTLKKLNGINIHLSISHEREYANATVIIEK